MDYEKRDYHFIVRSNDPFELLQVSASLESKLGGPSQVVKDSFEVLKSKMSTRLIVFGPAPSNIENIQINNTIRNNRYGLMLFRPSKDCRQMMQQSPTILIHGFYLASTLYALHYAKTPNVFLMPHGSLENYQEAKGTIKKFIFRKLVLLLSGDRKIHFLVGTELESFSIRSIFPKHPITPVGLGVDQKIYNSAKASELSYDALNEPIILGCVSRISEKKRIDLCIRALATLNYRASKYRLQIFGTGDKGLEFFLKNLVTELNLDDFVTFSGFVEPEARIEALQEIDMLLLPSENENFALAVAESIAAGKPVIISQFVAMHKFVQSTNTGVIISSLDAAEIALSVEEVANNYQVYRKNCLKSAKLLTWDSVIKNWLQVLKQEGKN